MLAAENGALPNGKVGGMGDVTHFLPEALAERGFAVTVLTPAYGRFARLPGTQRLGTLEVPFGTSTEQVDWYSVSVPDSKVAYQVVDHAEFSPCGPGRIYCNDGADAPFQTDATKFAFFSAAAATVVCRLGKPPDVVHLHDWHLGFYLILRAFDLRYRELRAIRTVFTIHNLALQGTRPLRVTDSSLAAWYPWLRYRPEDVADPAHTDCVNPMAAAIRLADMVNTVSPTYAREVQRPSVAERGFQGGERLEEILKRAASEGRLVGILNGCDYSQKKPRRPGWKKLIEMMARQVVEWIARESSVGSAHYFAERKLTKLGGKRPRTLLTNVGRIVDQKVRLFREPVGPGESALERILDGLGKDDLMIVLGSGDPDYEQFFTEVASRSANLLFLGGYSESVASALYASGDLFLMPSSFEPCGIGQMLAMRWGQPCVVHAVGGLRDTVTNRTGFPFDGETPRRQAQSFAREVTAAVSLRKASPQHWKRIVEAAARQRFDWGASADRYIGEVYGFGRD